MTIYSCIFIHNGALRGYRFINNKYYIAPPVAGGDMHGLENWKPLDGMAKQIIDLYVNTEFKNTMSLSEFIEKMFP
jgi:hypothetical protein